MMKTIGIIALIFAALNLVALIVGIASPDAPTQFIGRKIGATITFGIVGAVLYYNGKKKENK